MSDKPDLDSEEPSAKVIDLRSPAHDQAAPLHTATILTPSSDKSEYLVITSENWRDPDLELEVQRYAQILSGTLPFLLASERLVAELLEYRTHAVRAGKASAYPPHDRETRLAVAMGGLVRKLDASWTELLNEVKSAADPQLGHPRSPGKALRSAVRSAIDRIVSVSNILQGRRQEAALGTTPGEMAYLGKDRAWVTRALVDKAYRKWRYSIDKVASLSEAIRVLTANRAEVTEAFFSLRNFSVKF